MFTVTRLQAATYLLGVCLFSISFLVFLNSSISFVITNLIQRKGRVGNAVGTLGFADELLAIVACPCWGVISDRIGVRAVCVSGYAIVGLALLLLVQSRNVYPDLLLARLLFSLGGSATSTMVTAMLPLMVSPNKDVDSSAEEPVSFNGDIISPSVPSDALEDPQGDCQESTPYPKVLAQSSPTRLAGFVGLFTGFGALLALSVFLPLPAFFQNAGFRPDKAVIASFYIVGAISVVISLICFLGLRNLHGENRKVWFRSEQASKNYHSRLKALFNQAKASSAQVLDSFKLGFIKPELGLSYVGGFVARASSVGISLFIPLFVNAYFIDSGLCDEATHNPVNMKENCRDGYILAAKLTGVSQLVALICAPIFGYSADRYRRFNALLLIAASLGILGYVAMAVIRNPETGGENGTPWIFLVVAMLGVSQIGAIVCSLGLLGYCVLELQERTKHQLPKPSVNEEGDIDSSVIQGVCAAAGEQLTPSGNSDELDRENFESQRLLQHDRVNRGSYKYQTGSIAGVYSLWGASGILLLTKVGGKIFDDLSPVGPFYMLAIFNALLLAYGLTNGVIEWKIKNKKNL